MSCRYLHQGKYYTKESLIRELAENEKSLGRSVKTVFDSIATVRKSRNSGLVSETLELLRQRVTDAQNIIQSIKQNKTLTEKQKRSKISENRLIIKNTRKTIDEITTAASDSQLDIIMNLALQDAKMIEMMYESKSPLSTNELQFARNAVESWLSLGEVLNIKSSNDIKDDEPGDKQYLRDKYDQIRLRFDRLNGMTEKLAIEWVKAMHKLTDDQISQIQDTTIMTQYARELGTAGNALANRIAYILKDVALKVDIEHNKNYQTIDKMVDTIKDEAAFKKDEFKIFVQEQNDLHGNKTLGLVTNYNQSFYEDRKKNHDRLKQDLNKYKGDEAKTREAYQRYNHWNNENTIVFNAKPFLLNEEHTDAQRDAEMTRIKNLGFNEDEIGMMLQESDRKYKRYLEAKSQFESDLSYEIDKDPSLIPTGKTKEEYLNERVEEYDALRNPLKYTEQKLTPGVKLSAFYGSMYCYLIAAKTTKDGKSTGYYNEKFQAIRENPKLYAFYKWFSEFMNESLSYLPQEEIDDLQSNFLAEISSRAAKEYGLTNLRTSVKNFGDWLLKAFTVPEFQARVDQNPFTKKERRSFQARFINENIPLEERSRDLGQIAKMFSDMALIYKYKNTAKTEVDLLNDVLQQTKGSYVRNSRLNTLEARSENAVRLQQQADWTVREGFYGIKDKDTGIDEMGQFFHWAELLTGKWYKSPKAKIAKGIEDRVKVIDQYLDQDNLTVEDTENKKKERAMLVTEYYKLGGRKFSFSALVDSLIGTTRSISLGFAPASAIRNLVVGKINNYEHAKGGRDFGMKEYIWANNKVKAASAKYFTMGKAIPSDAKLIFKLMIDSGIAEGEDGMYLSSMIDGNTSFDKLRKMMPKAYTWLSSGDYHFKAEMMLAYMKKLQVKTSLGEASFIDVFKEDGSYNEEKYGPWNASDNNGKTFEDFYRDRLIFIRQLANKLHGASGRGVMVQGKSTAIGRLLFLFKSWLPETVGVRFDPKHIDGYLQREEEGYYRTFFKIFTDKKLKIFKMMLDVTLGKDAGITDEMVLANFKKAVAEAQILILLWGSYILLKSMAPDDDDKKKTYNMFVLRQLSDLNRDLTYYLSINSISELQRDILPVIRTLKAWGDGIKAATYHSLAILDDEGDLMYDDERTFLKLTKCFPVLSNINRFLYFTKKVN